MFSSLTHGQSTWVGQCCQHLHLCMMLACRNMLWGATQGPWPTLEALSCRGIWGAWTCSMGSCWVILKTTEGSAGIASKCFCLVCRLFIHLLEGAHHYTHPHILYSPPWSCPKLVIDLSKPGHYSSIFLTWDILQAGTGQGADISP